MRKITLVGVLAGLCLVVEAQQLELSPYALGERVPDIKIRKIINHKSDTASFSSFGKKLIILSFWNTHCGACIAMFPMEDSLQKEFKDNLQFLLVTEETEKEVGAFFEKHKNRYKIPAAIPIITGDKILRKLFLQAYNPHYVWLEPNGTLLAQTSGDLVNRAVISITLRNLSGRYATMQNQTLPANVYKFLPPDPVQEAYLKQNQQQ